MIINRTLAFLGTMTPVLQAMAVRGEEHSLLKEASLDSARQFAMHHIIELDEGGMSELASACKAVGLEDLFLTAIKIAK